MPEEKRAIINKETLIPIGFVLTLMAGAWFASDLNSRVRNLETNMITITTMSERMARVEEKVDAIRETLSGAEITK